MDNSGTSTNGGTRRREREAKGGRIIGGIILIVLGGLFLLHNFYPWVRLDDYWPVILIVIGFVMVWRSRTRE